jgi:hypothetical protein
MVSKMKYLILILTFLMVGCSTTKLVNIHKDLKIEPICIFSKYTEEEKAAMTDDVVIRTGKNQEDCAIREEQALKDIKLHNDLHK